MNEILTTLNKLRADTKGGLERFMGDEEMYLKYIRNFPDEKTMGELVKAVEAKDYKAAEEAVHALKGIVSGLGFNPLTDASVDMLEELRAGNTEDALEAYEDVEKYYKVFCEAIDQWRGK